MNLSAMKDLAINCFYADLYCTHKKVIMGMRWGVGLSNVALPMLKLVYRRINKQWGRFSCAYLSLPEKKVYPLGDVLGLILISHCD